VDDPYTFGKIAATNAISDIYAMGGKPLMAVSIFGWPIKKLPVDVAKQVIAGGKCVCENAGIPLAGGHSIDSPEPIFGLAVTGLVENVNLKKNNSATEGCELFLTKPLGIGILATAQKRKKIEAQDLSQAIDVMCTLNSIGEDIAKIKGVKALTDVTGFGLLGHLAEICEGSDISAVIDFEKVPLLDNTSKYLSMGCTPGGTRNNFASYGHNISPLTEDQMNILCDPQTSGGLLVAVEKNSVEEFLNVTKNAGLHLDSIGITVPKSNHFVKVV
jgi:selenide,water dikinase